MRKCAAAHAGDRQHAESKWARRVCVRFSKRSHVHQGRRTRGSVCVCVRARATHDTHARETRHTRARQHARDNTRALSRATTRVRACLLCDTVRACACVRARVGLCVLCEPAGGLALSLRPGDGAACAQYGVYYGQRLTRRSALFSNAGRTRFCAYFFSFSTPQSCRITKLQSGLRG